MENLHIIQPMPTANYYCNDKRKNTGGTGTGTGGCGTGGTSTNTNTGTGTGTGIGGNSTINQYFYSIRESENYYLYNK
jgi:hypothetical protein